MEKERDKRGLRERERERKRERERERMQRHNQTLNCRRRKEKQTFLHISGQCFANRDFDIEIFELLIQFIIRRLRSLIAFLNRRERERERERER
jgi:hypothetical protein